ncbi:MAG TPA: hypothetical protein VN363_03035 [Anaerolineales bacterium]|nr:hypothetical protein [Anaerolineales bacterium]
MHAVFADALSAASQEGLWAMLRLCSRELFSLPHALAREHFQSGWKEEASMDNRLQISAVSPAASPASAGQGPVYAWKDVLLAMLPFGVILLVEVLVRLFVVSGLLARESPIRQPLNIALISLLIITFLLGLVLAWRQKWPVWSAVWYPFFLLVPVILVGWLLNLLFDASDMQDGLYIFIPFTLAVLLYTVTRLNRLRGLLAVLTVLYFFWLPNMESVPEWIQVAIKLPSTILICLTIAYLLRRGDWRSGLFAVLAMNLAVGALHSYAGIYYGGTLPFVAPGPNLVEVLRSLVPQYLAGGAILLGPLFARMVRQAGRSGSSYSRVSYHISLVGLMLVILVMLYALLQGSSSSSELWISLLKDNVHSAVILLGIAMYLVGLFLTYRGARNAAARPGWVETILLAVLPLAIPLTFALPFITWKWPLTLLYGVPLLWELPHAVSLSIGLVWLVLSVWVVTRETAGPAAAVMVTPAISDPKIL